jgi:hypothetical protein
MSDFFFALVADYGVPIVFVVTFLSCLDLPVPSSILMLTSGGFAATGDLTLSTVLAAAFIGAVLGDNAGYWIARASGDRMQNWLEKIPSATLYATNPNPSWKNGAARRCSFPAGWWPRLVPTSTTSAASRASLGSALHFGVSQERSSGSASMSVSASHSPTTSP